MMRLSAIEAKHVQKKLQEYEELQYQTVDPIPYFKLKKRNKTKINVSSGLRNLPCKVEPCAPYPQFSSDGNNLRFDKQKFQDFLNNHPIIKETLGKIPEGNSLLVWLKSPQQISLSLNPARMGFPTSNTVHGRASFLLNTITTNSFLDQWNMWINSGWINTIKAGGVSLAVSFISGLLDSLIEHVFEGYPTIIKWSKRILGGLLTIVSMVFLAFAIYFIVIGSLPILSFFITLFVSFITSIIGWWLAKSFARFLSYILPESTKSFFQWKTLFNNTKNIEINDELSCDTDDSYSIAEDEQDFVEDIHKCNSNVGGYLNVGKCHICYKNPATIALVHEGLEVAHTTYCAHCWKKYNLGQICACGVKVVSHFELETVENKPTCSHGTCIYVGECDRCKDNGKSNTVTSYRASLNDEKQIVDVELLYCNSHKPERNMEKFYFGSVFGFGYSIENDDSFDTSPFETDTSENES